jgi:hypothetical protein
MLRKNVFDLAYFVQFFPEVHRKLAIVSQLFNCH